MTARTQGLSLFALGWGEGGGDLALLLEDAGVGELEWNWGTNVRCAAVAKVCRVCDFMGSGYWRYSRGGGGGGKKAMAGNARRIRSGPGLWGTLGGSRARATGIHSERGEASILGNCTMLPRDFERGNRQDRQIETISYPLEQLF